MKKSPMTKAISLLLCLVLVLGMVPARALATEESTTQPADDTTVQSSEPSTLTVYVNGKDVKEIEDDTISWDEETKTLTLNNASILAENGTYKGSGIYVVGADTLVLELVGENTVEGKFNGRDEYSKPVDDIFANAAISVTEGLTIRGDGSLTATDLAIGSDDKSNPIRSAGIFAGGDLTIESGTIRAVGNSSDNQYNDSSGIICGDYDTLSTLSISGGTINATGASNGITAYDTIRVSGGSVNADGKDGDGLYAYNYIKNILSTTVFISGGTVTLRGAGEATFSMLSCGGYEHPMWTTAEDGPMNYNRVPSMAGLLSGYLRIEPADLRLVQPAPQNQYTVDVENLSGGEVTAAYQWYQLHTQPVTSEDVDVAEVCTYDETTGLWLIPSMYEANSCMLAWAAAPGNIVTLEFQNPKEGLLIAITNTAMFNDLSGGVFSYTVTEADIDPETGLFILRIGAEHDIQVKISSSTAEEVQTTCGTANRFACDTAGTYFCRATVFQNDAVKGTMESGRFDYLPSNTVTFDPNGGTCETASAETQSGVHTLAALPEASRTGYTFAGWADADGNPVTTDTLITEDITLYAQWIINKYTLTVEGLDGVIYQEQIPYGTDLDAILSGLNLGDITVDGGVYTFTGVFEPTPEATMPAGAVTLKAVYAYTGWMEEANGITYLIHDEKVYFNEWVEIGSETYYFDANSHVLRDIALLDGEYYAFDHETGKFLADYTGIYEARSGDVYYIKNGVAVERCEIMDHADEDSNGRCDWCDCPVKFAKLRFASVSMNGNLAINYYLRLSDEIISDETAYMEFTMADGTVTRIPVSAGIKTDYNGETYYVYSCVVKAKEMTDDVICQIFYEGGSTAPFTYSVRTYAMNILEKSKNEDMKALVKAMLHYGAAAQVYFGYNTDRLANAGLEAPDYSGVTINGFDLNLGQGTQNAKFCSVSLLVKSDTTLRFYFDSLIAATYHGRNLNVYQLNGMYYVDVAGIAAKDLDENVTIIINDGTETAEVSFNPMAYCQGVMDDTAGTFSDRLKDLVRAMYLYNQAANAYFEEV